MTELCGRSRLPMVSPDPCLCEPGFISDGWNSRVHQGMGFDERQGLIWEVDGGFVSFREAMFGTTARPEMKIAIFNHSLSHNCILRREHTFRGKEVKRGMNDSKARGVI